MTATPIDRAEPPTGTIMARLDRPAAATGTTVAVIADPHVATRSEGTSKLFEHTESHLRNAVADLRRRDVDAVVSVGDLTKDGEPWNYDAVDVALADLDAPFLSVPGNHDVPKAEDDHDALPVQAFATRYATGSFPFVERVGGVDLVGVNSAGSADRLYDSHEGAVDDRQLAWLEDALPDLDAPVVLSHYNLPAMSDQMTDYRDAVAPEMPMPPTMRDPDPFADVLADHDVPLLVTGHLHLPSTALSGGVREVMAPTTCSYPQGYVLLEVDERGTTVRFVPVADHGGMRRGYHERRIDTDVSRGLTAMAAVRVANFPLVEEW